MKELLPIGSVVLLEGATKSLLIVGTTQMDEEKNEYDYIACLYPEGYINSETFFLFNHEDIEEVKFIGYISAESQAYNLMLKTGELQALVEEGKKLESFE